jgi:hypothetical protein
VLQISPAHRRRTSVLLAASLALALTLAFALSRTSPAPAGTNPNNYDCRGHLQRGEPQPDDPSATQVKYVFGCSGPITGYQIQPQIPATGFETEVFALDRATKEVVPTDSFSCNGDVPGYGINCVGTYQGNYEVLAGAFGIDGKLCTEPRVDALLTVMYASVDAKGKLTQAISGPFDLGRPYGCKASKWSGKTRMAQG